LVYECRSARGSLKCAPGVVVGRDTLTEGPCHTPLSGMSRKILAANK
jgi:hypothetical protein